MASLDSESMFCFIPPAGNFSFFHLNIAIYLTHLVLYNKLKMEHQVKSSPLENTIGTHSVCSQFELDYSLFEINPPGFSPSENEKSVPEQKKSQKYQNSQPFLRIWTNQDENLLMKLHRKIGNKWTLLTQYYPGTSQNFIKNHFYSRLRKSIRRLNKFIGTFFPKRFVKFKLNIIFKLSNISEGKTSEKQKIASQIYQFYRDFLYRLIQFSQNDKSEQKFGKLSQEETMKLQSLILGLVALQNLFRLIRGQRSAKGKKKNIAYLRQFSFRLSLQSQTLMIITKERIYLQNYESADEFTQIQCQNQEKSRPIGCFTSIDACKSSKKDRHEQQKVQRIHKDITQRMNQFEKLEMEQQEIEEPIQVWRDYFGCQMKEYDICNHNEENSEAFKNLHIFQSKDFGFSIDNSAW